MTPVKEQSKATGLVSPALQTTPTTKQNTDKCPKTSDQVGSIKGQPGLTDEGPLGNDDKKCQWCKRVFKHVNKHLWRCKMRPAELVTEPQARGDDIRNIMSEQGTSQVNNHSASRVPASSDIQFHYKELRSSNCPQRERKEYGRV